MSFLAPLFLLGALAVAGPVIFHLIRRVTRERTPFGSLMFLRPAPPRLTNRSHVEHWLLLLLRAAALALLTAAFARPFFRSEAPAADATGPGKKVAVLVDASASMRRAGLWEAAVKSADGVIDSLGPADSAAVLLFDSQVKTVIGFDQWRRTPVGDRAALAKGALADAKPGQSGTRLAAALTTAADALLEGAADSPNKTGHEIVLISDLQEGGAADALQNREWPEEVKLTLKTVKAAALGNAGLQAAAEDRSGDPDKIHEARVRVVNSSDSTVETFQVGWADASGQSFAGKAQDAHVPAGRSTLVTLAWPEGVSGSARVLLRGDQADFDNLLTLTPPATERRTVLHFGEDSPDDAKRPLFFLRHALPNNRAAAVTAAPVSPTAAPPPDSIRDAALLFLTGSVSGPAAEAARAAVDGGKTAVVVLDSAEAAATVAALTGQPLTAEERKPDTYAMLAKMDFTHPLLAPFADPRFSDFTKIRFWKYRRVKAVDVPGARIIAEFDNGDPAILEAPLGKGRLLLLTSGWHPADSQLALSSKFPTLLASLLEWTGALARPATGFIAGEALPLSRVAPFSEPATLTGPDGKPAAVAVGDAPSIAEPGAHTLTWPGGARSFAVNLDPRESLTAPLAAEDLEKLGVPAGADAAAAEKRAASPELSPAAEAEQRQKIWRWLLAAAMLVLIAETIVAGLTARRSAPTPNADPST